MTHENGKTPIFSAWLPNGKDDLREIVGLLEQRAKNADVSSRL
jgi:hypothetical protein